jgi:hypothetical protein
MNKDEDQNSRVETDAKPAQQSTTSPEQNTSGVIILQWLSYAFWGWLILGLIWLLSVILINALLDRPVSDVVPYAIAASVVLLPIAFVTDLFYRKHEPITKVGGAMVIMVIHAVLFALLGIVSLIVAVFNGLNAAIETSGNSDAQLVVMFTALGATVLYAAAFVRTLNPFKSKKPLLVYSVAMTSVTILLLALAIAGPFVQTIATRDDRRIEQNLPSVSQAVRSYIEANEKLPANLSDIRLDDDESEQLVKDGLVTYKAENSVPSTESPRNIEHRFQLCVSYKQADKSNRSYGSSYAENKDDYTAGYLNTYGHGKGNVCYKLSTITEAPASIINDDFQNNDGMKIQPVILN